MAFCCFGDQQSAPVLLLPLTLQGSVPWDFMLLLKPPEHWVLRQAVGSAELGESTCAVRHLAESRTVLKKETCPLLGWLAELAHLLTIAMRRWQGFYRI